MSNVITGKVGQKPTSPVPQVGEVRRFSFTADAVSKNGQPYKKLKRENVGFGKPYRIKSVQQLGGQDQHGNVYFWMTMTPEAEQQPNGNGATATQIRAATPKIGQELYLRRSVSLMTAVQSALGTETREGLVLAVYSQAVKDGYLSTEPAKPEVQETPDDDEVPEFLPDNDGDNDDENFDL